MFPMLLQLFAQFLSSCSNLSFVTIGISSDLSPEIIVWNRLFSFWYSQMVPSVVSLEKFFVLCSVSYIGIFPSACPLIMGKPIIEKILHQLPFCVPQYSNFVFVRRRRPVFFYMWICILIFGESLNSYYT